MTTVMIFLGLYLIHRSVSRHDDDICARMVQWVCIFVMSALLVYAAASATGERIADHIPVRFVRGGGR